MGGGVGEGLLVSIFIAEKEGHIGDDLQLNSNPKENSVVGVLLGALPTNRLVARLQLIDT